MSQQLVKKGANGKHENVMPKSWIEAIKDKNTGKTLVEILQSFNMYFLSYDGNSTSTRCLVPTMLRKKGLWITYVKYDGNVYTEWYAADEIDDTSWGDSSNWRVGNNTLVGDITISANGNWVINGTETEFKAVGEKGNTPLVRFGSNNKFQVSYNNGEKWLDISDSITNNLRIKKYIGINESLPTSGVEEGAIYMKGPYYAEDDTLNDNPIYRMWVYAWKGNTLAWQDNGEFTSIVAGVVQETGDSETEVMSQKAVSEKIIVNIKIISSKQAEYENLATNEYSYNPATKKIYFKGVDGFIHSAFPYNTVYRYVDKLLLFGNEGQLVVLDSVIYLSAWSNDATTLLSGGKGSFVYNTYSKSIEMVTDSQLWSFDFNNKSIFVYQEEFYSWDAEHKVLTRLKSIDNLIEAINSIDQKSNIGIQAKNILDEIVVKSVGEERQNNETYDIIISPSTGKETDYSGAYASGYIPVIGGKEYYVSGSMTWGNAVYAWYDENKVFISGYAAAEGSTVTKLVNELVLAPQNAAYIRVCRWTTNQEGKVNNVYLSVIGNSSSNWGGKKWVCVGDSLTEHNSKATMNYHDYVAQATGIEVVNMGVSGTGYKRQEDNGNAFYQRVENIPIDADVITIFGSGNDGAYWGSALGTASDTTTDTIGGCINITIDNILSRIPLAVIGIVSPCPWGDYPPSTNNAMKRYSNLLKEICELRGIPFLNLYLNSGLRPWDETFRELAYSRDNGGSVHPDENGHKLIAPRFKAFLESLIM